MWCSLSLSLEPGHLVAGSAVDSCLIQGNTEQSLTLVEHARACCFLSFRLYSHLSPLIPCPGYTFPQTTKWTFKKYVGIIYFKKGSYKVRTV